jgi:arylsulfatase
MELYHVDTDRSESNNLAKERTGKFTLSGDGLGIGRDSGDAVSPDSKTPGEFTGRTILLVGVTVEKAQYRDLGTPAATAVAAD